MVVVVPGAVLPLAVEGVLPLTRFVFVELPAEFLKPPEPPHPTIAPSKNKQNRRKICRIQPPLTWPAAAATSPIKGSYGCINSAHIRGTP